MSRRSSAIADTPRPAQVRPELAVSSEVRAGRAFDAGLLFLFLGLTFLLGIFPVKDTDFWWHLKAGDLVRRTGWVPLADNLTYGAEGHRWIDLHWVFQLLMSFGFERFGVAGLNLGKCVVTTVAVGLLVTSGRRDWPTWATLLAWIPALLVLSGRMYLRPETLTLLYLAADVAILARWDRRPLLAIGLPIVQMFWVNTQGLFVFGPFLVGVALLDAATRPGAFSPERRVWWRISLGAMVATVLACLANPYTFQGAAYPIELLGTMKNPIFARSIGELKPLEMLFREIGFNSLPFDLHMAVFVLGAFSFLIPAIWRVVVRVEDHRAARTLGKLEPSAQAPREKSNKPPRKSRRKSPSETPTGRPLPGFRVALYLTFSALSLAASRNSHQFAAVVGTVTAWNCAEWAAEVRDRLRRLRPATDPATRLGPRLITLAALVLTIAAVGSGRFYAWSQEGRTIGLGEEPLWFPHDAVKAAGEPGMPDRLVAYHNGHASLFEYYWGPGKKVYTDARLEVMGPELYTEYRQLQEKIEFDQAGWSDELDKMGRPSVLLDTTDTTNSGMVATLLIARRWRCVWFDPVAAVFVHDSYRAVIPAHAVDFLARHYGHEADSSRADLAYLRAFTRSIRGVATMTYYRPGGESAARSLIWLGLDYARRLQSLDPTGLDGYKQAGLIDATRGALPGDKAIPRFRLPFDPTIDLPLALASYELIQALAIDPDDGISLYQLAILDMMRGMDETAVPLLERFTHQPDKNLQQQKEKTRAAEIAAEMVRRLGPSPATTWKNLSELEQLVDSLGRSGRDASAADVIEAAHRADARPWPWADRLATICLHLGQPARAREVWRRATDAPPALQAARIAATYLVEGDYDLARSAAREAIDADPSLFEAHFLLASLEQRLGRADAAVAAAIDAEQVAPNDRCRNLVRQIIAEASPYRKGLASASAPRRAEPPASAR